MSGSGRGRGRTGGRGRSRLFRQVQTMRRELRDANTGRFAKATARIRLPPWEQFAKQYRTVRLQHGSTNNSGTITFTDITIRGWGKLGDSLLYDQAPQTAVAIYHLPGHEPSTNVPFLHRHKTLEELDEEASEDEDFVEFTK